MMGRQDPKKRRQDPLLTKQVSSKAQYNAFGGHAGTKKEPSRIRPGLVFDHKHGPLHFLNGMAFYNYSKKGGFFNQPKPAIESFISTTYKWRDALFPMAEEGCRKDLDKIFFTWTGDAARLASERSLYSTWVCYKTRRSKELNGSIPLTIRFEPKILFEMLP